MMMPDECQLRQMKSMKCIVRFSRKQMTRVLPAVVQEFKPLGILWQLRANVIALHEDGPDSQCHADKELVGACPQKDAKVGI